MTVSTQYCKGYEFEDVCVDDGVLFSCKLDECELSEGIDAL